MKKSLLFSSVLFALFFAQCKDDDPVQVNPDPSDNQIVQKYLDIDLTASPNYAAPSYPTHYDANILNQDNAPSVNPVTDAGALLGRVLFYDKNLSRNNAVSCASCHNQAKGFTDDKVLSEGFAGGLTGKHSMRLGNTNFYTGDAMFWDKRARDLEDQTTQPIQDHTEMGFDASIGGIDSLLRKMKNLEYYPILFENAFGTEEISELRMQMALAQFIRSMVSTGSKFDLGFAQVFNTGQPGAGVQQPFPNFTAQENQGKQLYFTAPPQGGAGCVACHGSPTFSLAANSLNNGLDANETVIFKAPSLKNVGVAGPYMHDGRFATLMQVVDHYNTGIQDGPTLDNRLRAPAGGPGGPLQAIRLNLDQQEKEALVAFLHTLTDNNLLTDTKFADPFLP